MMNKKVVVGVMIFSIALFSISLISAGWLSDLFTFGEDKGGEGELAESLDVSITMANSAPHIESWIEPVGFGSGGDCDLPSTTVPITIFVSDENGDSDLDSGTVTVQFSRGGQNRPTIPASCSPGVSDGDEYLDFTCSVDMQYFDEPSNQWIITVSAADNAGTPADNDNQASDGGGSYPYFTYGSSLSIRLKDSNDPDASTAGGSGEDTLEWGGITAASLNVDATNNLEVENCGNIEISGSGTSWLSILGRDLESATDPVLNPDLIEPDSFSVDETVTSCTIGQTLSKPAASLNINGATLLRGSGAKRDLYFCIQSINPTGSPIRADSYKTQSSPNNWELNAAQ